MNLTKVQTELKALFSKRFAVGFALVAILVAIFAWQSYVMKTEGDAKFADLNAKLEQQQKDSAKSLADLRSELLRKNAEVQQKQGQLDESLNEFRDEYNEKTFEILEALRASEQKSAEELGKLKQEIKLKTGDFSQIVDKYMPAVVSIITDKGQGSGAIISQDGYIVTNWHVVANATRISAMPYNRKALAAKFVGASDSMDIAVLKVEGLKYTYFEFGDSGFLRAGEKVIAMGNPSGLSFTVTEGIVSATGRVMKPFEFGLIQTDVPINPGNSGGPLVNIEGKILGINTLKIKGAESLGFAIPSNIVKEVVPKIIEAAKKRQESGQT